MTQRETAVYLMDDGVVEERISITGVPSPRSTTLMDEEAINREWNSLIELQNRIAHNEHAFFRCGFASPEVSLVVMIIFWVIIAFYEGLRDYEVKHFETVIVYFLAFCMFAALVSTQMRFYFVTWVIFTVEFIWNTILLYFLIDMYAERNNSAATPELSIFLFYTWPELHNYILRMIHEDFYGYACMYFLKLIFIIVLLMNSVQIRHLQNMEKELNERRRRIGCLLNDLRRHDTQTSILPPFSYDIEAPDVITPVGSPAHTQVSSMTLVTCTADGSVTPVGNRANDSNLVTTTEEVLSSRRVEYAANSSTC